MYNKIKTKGDNHFDIWACIKSACEKNYRFSFTKINVGPAI